MRIFKIFIVALFIMSLSLSCFFTGCSDNGITDNGDGNGNGTPTVTGEIIGFRTYTIDLSTGRASYENYTPAIEDEDGNIFMLFEVGMSINYIYDGMSMSGANVEIAGYAYSDTLSDCENRNVGGKTRRISYTGREVAVTGTIETVTSQSFDGDMIDVEKIEDLP